MSTKIERYMRTMFGYSAKPYEGFLGAYNMGVWGVSVSGQRSLDQGLLVSGEVLTRAPKTTTYKNNNPPAQNFVKYYDTPSLWGMGDEWGGIGQGLYSAIEGASAVLGIRPEEGLSESEIERIQSYMRVHYSRDWNGSLDGTPWSTVGKIANVQAKMDEVAAWSNLVNRWKTVIGQSRYLVDITSLSPPVPGSEAQVGICDGISKCLKKWLKVAVATPDAAPRLMIRILFGNTCINMPKNYTYWTEFMDLVRTTLRQYVDLIASSRARYKPVVLYGSDMGKIIATFNHSKIVAGDGQYAVVGGHNMCEEVSSNTAPCIHDVTCEVTGPGARTANAFAGSLWLKAAESGRLYIHRFNWQKNAFDDLSHESTKKWAPNNYWAYELGDQAEVEKVLKNQFWYYPMENLPGSASVDPPDGSVPATAIMGIGRWGDTKVFNVDGAVGLQLDTPIHATHACHYASDILKRLMIADRKNTVIRMSQQDLINTGYFGGKQKSQHTICEALGRRLIDTPTGTAIQVVVSTRFTQNSEGLAYSYGDGPREAAERISDTVVGARQASSPKNNLPDRLAVLNLATSIGNAQIHAVTSADDPSFCTVAPLAFCDARGTTRDRGSYVWPNAKYIWDRLYTCSRFWNDDDTNQLKFGPGNHSKVMYVSEGGADSKALVLIGSDNMYPSPLSEFSFVIEGEEAVKLFRTQYWDRLWEYSARLGFTVKNDGTVE